MGTFEPWLGRAGKSNQPLRVNTMGAAFRWTNSGPCLKIAMAEAAQLAVRIMTMRATSAFLFRSTRTQPSFSPRAGTFRRIAGAAGALAILAASDAAADTADSRIQTVILTESAQTAAAVARANDEVRLLHARLIRSNRDLEAEKSRSGVSERQRRRIEGELREVQTEMEALLSRLADQSAEYAASIKAYRAGLTGLLESNDPQIKAALERYAAGDSAALDQLQAHTNLRYESDGTAFRPY